jgi:hypothetical protein
MANAAKVRHECIAPTVNNASAESLRRKLLRLVRQAAYPPEIP